eukprot:CAMPEP_0168521204 /NCGR_PEP_ID=MMETSP0405-20121227/8513_1 /TAXON_ID=498012 /ORGANISM="Trichosphaerium sp, Strain Am-I-7 wt" /LENGTH=391 /DNA_ID=CAMNT_0008542371 /DNA_START=128 /DNA_END=1300 /DNA_ORIENTATION=+
MINNEDVDTINQGFKELERSQFVTQKLFSGSVVLPTNVQINVKCLDTLINASLHEDKGVQKQAITWLYKLAVQYPEIRPLLAHAPRLEKILSTLPEKPEEYQDSTTWLLTAMTTNLLVEHMENVKTAKDALFTALKKLSKADNNLAQIAQQQIENARAGKSDDNLNSRVLALAAREVEPLTFRGPTYSGASTWSCLAFAAGASVWGRTMWASRVTIRSLHNYPSAMIKKFSKSRRVGMWIGAFMLMDLLGASLLKYASATDMSIDLDNYVGEKPTDIALAIRPIIDAIEPERENHKFDLSIPGVDLKLPLRTLWAMEQTFWFGAGALVLLGTQRYVFFPLLAASLYNHGDSEWLRYVQSKVSEDSDLFSLEGAQSMAMCAYNTSTKWIKEQ